MAYDFPFDLKRLGRVSLAEASSRLAMTSKKFISPKRG